MRYVQTLDHPTQGRVPFYGANIKSKYNKVPLYFLKGGKLFGFFFGTVWGVFFGFLFAFNLQHLEGITLHFAWYLHDLGSKFCQITSDFSPCSPHLCGICSISTLAHLVLHRICE